MATSPGVAIFMKYTFELCAAVAKQFDAKIAFRERANKEYQWLFRNGLLDLACAHMKQRRYLTDELIGESASNYKNKRAFKLGDQSAYNAALKRGILDRVCAHMVSKHRELADQQISEIASKFESRSEFARRDSGAYQTAVKRGILDAVCAHMDGSGTRRLTNEEILEIAKKYATRNDFKLGDFGAYTTAIRRGLIVQACEHMEYGASGFREDKPAVLYQFQVITVDGLKLFKVGITNRKPSQRLVTMGLVPGTKAELVGCIKFAFGRDARMAEKTLHRLIDGHRYAGLPVMKNGNTELFTVAAFNPNL